MSLVLYAVSDAADCDGAGLHGAPLRPVPESGLVAVVSAHDTPRLRAGAADLWAYEEVMERLMAERTILPMRFGTVLADEGQVREVLRERRAELAAGLERVRGAIELAVRAGWREPEPPATRHDTGTAYMLDRVALHRRARELADRLDPLAALAREIRSRLVDRAEHPVLGAYLVERALTGEFADRVRDLDQRHPDMELVCTGPWPPYSFSPRGDR